MGLNYIIYTKEVFPFSLEEYSNVWYLDSLNSNQRVTREEYLSLSFDVCIVFGRIDFFILYPIRASKTYLILNEYQLNTQLENGNIFSLNNECFLMNNLSNVEVLIYSSEKKEVPYKIFSNEKELLGILPRKTHEVNILKNFEGNFDKLSINKKLKIHTSIDTLQGVNTFVINSYPENLNLPKLTMEPECNMYWMNPHWVSKKRCIPRNMIEWHLSYNVPQLLSFQKPTRLRELSAIISRENRLEGHRKRLSFLQYIDDKIEYDLFGKHIHPLKNYRGKLKNKEDGLIHYKYSIAIENCSEKGYFTEKIVDCILSECVPFYWGCPNISEYINERCYILLDLQNDEKSLRILQDSIRNNEYASRLKYLQIEKTRILFSLSLYPTLLRYLNNDYGVSLPTYVINLNRRLDRWEQFTNNACNHLEVYSRYEAIDGKEYTLTPEEKDLLTYYPLKRYPWRNGYESHNNRPGVVGCLLSHWKLWGKIEKNPKERGMTLILEDDILFGYKFSFRLRELYSYLSTITFDICFIGYLDDVEEYNDPIVYSKGNISVHRFNPYPARKHGGGTHGYILSREGASKLRKCGLKYGIPQPIDWFIIEMFPELIALKCKPFLVYQNTTLRSDIQETLQLLRR